MPFLPSAPREDAHLWTREFLLLFLLAMFSNGFVAVFYCFEQWLAGLDIAAHWRGVLLSAMFFLLMLGRPVASVWVIRHSALPIMTGAVILNSLCMCSYGLVSSPYAILGLRMLQGLALAAFSSSVTAVLTNCIPTGQSARGFAMFSLTLLLPYALVPLLSERMLPLLHSEATLYALAGIMGIPALFMVWLLSRQSTRPHIAPHAQVGMSQTLRALRHSGLGWLFLSSGFFGATTVLVICFVKGLAQGMHCNSSLFFTVYTVLVMLTRLCGGNHLDTLPRRPVMYICAVCMALSLGALSLGISWLFLPMAGLYGLGLGLYYPLLAASIYDGSRLENRSLNSNMMMLTFDVSAAFTPLLGGVVVSVGWGYGGVFLLAATMTLLSAGSAFLYRCRSRGNAAQSSVVTR